MQLLGRHVFGRPDRPMELLLEQVGQLLMARQAEIDQHGVTGGAKQDVGRLEIEMQHVLLVQIARARRRSPTPMRKTSSTARAPSNSALSQRRPGDLLHHDVRLHGEIAVRDPARAHAGR